MKKNATDLNIFIWILLLAPMSDSCLEIMGFEFESRNKIVSYINIFVYANLNW